MIDWRELLFVLIRAGNSETVIARECEVNKASVSNWLNEKHMPKGDSAVTLAVWYWQITGGKGLPVISHV